MLSPIYSKCESTDLLYILCQVLSIEKAGHRLWPDSRNIELYECTNCFLLMTTVLKCLCTLLLYYFHLFSVIYLKAIMPLLKKSEQSCFFICFFCWNICIIYTLFVLSHFIKELNRKEQTWIPINIITWSYIIIIFFTADM